MKQEQSSLGLSVDQWSELVAQGYQIPVTIPVMGTSMLPVIRYAVEPVTIVPLTREPLEGDIVLFRRQDGALVIHRVFRVLDGGSMVQTWGDNCWSKDRPVLRKDVLGLAVSVNRKGREVALDTERQRRWGVKWMTSPVRRRLWFTGRKLRWLPGKLIRRIWPDFHKERK